MFLLLSSNKVFHGSLCGLEKPWAHCCLSDDDYVVLTMLSAPWVLEDLHCCGGQNFICSCSACTPAVLVQVSESVAALSSSSGICLYITAKFNIFAREFSLLDLFACQTIFSPTCTHPQWESAKQVNQTFLSFRLVLDFSLSPLFMSFLN